MPASFTVAGVRAAMRALAVALALAPMAPMASEAAPKVVADIAPVGALVAQVMAGLGTPVVLIAGGGDPHDFQLRPSQAAALHDADLLIWIGPSLTPWLGRAAAATEAVSVPLQDAPGIVRRPPMFGAGPGEGAAGDPHLWLDPENGIAMISRIAAALAATDPANAAAYAGNAARAKARLTALEAAIASELAPYRDRRLVVFHDAFAHFAGRFGITIVGSLALGDAADPGAAALSALRRDIAEQGADCLFAEPQHSPALIRSLAADTGIRVGQLDPEGTTVPPGADAYDRTVRAVADGIVACLTS
jgi:zinc transport system substrate-binding protein